MIERIVTFGEAEKGKFSIPHFFKDLGKMESFLGNPPEESLGIFFAIQSLLFQRELIYFRVEEEGYSHQDYFSGIEYLQNWERDNLPLHAICLPGVGDQKIIEAIEPICKKEKSILILTEKDLYDYLTSK